MRDSRNGYESAKYGDKYSLEGGVIKTDYRDEPDWEPGLHREKNRPSRINDSMLPWNNSALVFEDLQSVRRNFPKFNLWILVWAPWET